MMTRNSRKNDNHNQSTSQEEQPGNTGVPSTSLQMQLQQFVPYIEGPKMDWTVNDGLYHQFLKWKLKCENILDCELANISEIRRCKKLISWSGDDGMDLVVSWNLNDEELNLETLWTRFEEFCKPQSNEVRARFDLLTSFRQGDKSVDEWFNAVQKQVTLCKYPPETASILQRDIFWFYLKDEEFVSKTLNEGCTDLQQYPASKVRQLAKKLESSKATARHIKQATSHAQAAQINLLRHQRTELAQKKKKGQIRKYTQNDGKPQKLTIQPRPVVPNVVIHDMPKALVAQQRSFNAKLATSMDTLLVSVFPSRIVRINKVRINTVRIKTSICIKRMRINTLHIN